MPQLDTSTWFITIVSMILTLFTMFQLKISKYTYMSNPELKSNEMQQVTPSETKWQKFIYLSLYQP